MLEKKKHSRKKCTKNELEVSKRGDTCSNVMWDQFNKEHDKIIEQLKNDNKNLLQQLIKLQTASNVEKFQAVQIEIMPESTMAYDHIYFGLQQLITHEQLSLLYDKDTAYQQDIKKLRESVLYKITEIIDQVIIDNESKVG